MVATGNPIAEKIHLKGFNGLRAIAALGVVITHTTGADFSNISILPTGLAVYSVTIFFTLSGFLITYLLFLEKEKQEISIRKFYMRRILKIWPLYFLYLLIAVYVIYFHIPGQLPGSLPWYLVFAANVPAILHTSLSYLGHYWSLGVEEQFYIFWPWLIKGSKNVLKGIIIFTALFLAAKLTVRLFFFSKENTLPLQSFFVTRFECMSFGGIGALLCLKRHSLFLKLATHKLTELVCWSCIVIVALNRFHVSNFLDHDIIAVVTVLIITNLSFNDKALIDLENRPLNFLGRISYGMYVIHPLIIAVADRWLSNLQLTSRWHYALLISTVIPATILIAWLSFEFFEKRFLRLKDRFSAVRSSP